MVFQEHGTGSSDRRAGQIDGAVVGYIAMPAGCHSEQRISFVPMRVHWLHLVCHGVVRICESETWKLSMYLFNGRGIKLDDEHF